MFSFFRTGVENCGEEFQRALLKCIGSWALPGLDRYVPLWVAIIAFLCGLLTGSLVTLLLQTCVCRTRVHLPGGTALELETVGEQLIETTHGEGPSARRRGVRPLRRGHGTMA
eukprot:2044164-Amphidinium_carterae.1